MTQFNKATITSLLTTQAEALTAEADGIAKEFIDLKRARAEAARPLIDVIDLEFKQIIRELRKGTTKEARRRIVDSHKDGSAKKQVEEVFALINPTALPSKVAELRSQSKRLTGVVTILNAVEGDTIDLNTMIRTGAIRLLPVVDPDTAASVAEVEVAEPATGTAAE